jgi:GTP cyclohydrolase I
MTTRGIKNSSSKTITTTFRGRFLEDEALAQRVIGMYKD